MGTDITGRRFGRLLILGKAEIVQKPSGEKRYLWLCLCDCGAQCKTFCNILLSGNTHSCGCLRSIAASARLATHGMRRTGEYRCWSGMVNRCHNPNNKDYKRYGALGIVVCDRWRVFQNFYADMGDRPSAKHSLDRFPNRGGGYELGNVRWATDIQQQNNRDGVHVLSDGRTIRDLADASGFPQPVLYDRIISQGWSVDRAISEPIRRHHADLS